jgi:hypothetical protein
MILLTAHDALQVHHRGGIRCQIGKASKGSHRRGRDRVRLSFVKSIFCFCYSLDIRELRSSLDTLRIETEKQSQNHLKLAHQIRAEMDEVTAEFHVKQINHRRSVQVPVERKFRDKQGQESYVKKSREKYETDCVRIRSYTQQVTFMTGADLQKVQQKLARTQQTLQGNEKDYARFTKELLELLPTWEKEWKEFCDSCQDLEEDLLEFMKDVVWAYANSISTACVADDLVQSTLVLSSIPDSFVTI